MEQGQSEKGLSSARETLKTQRGRERARVDLVVLRLWQAADRRRAASFPEPLRTRALRRLGEVA